MDHEEAGPSKRRQLGFEGAPVRPPSGGNVDNIINLSGDSSSDSEKEMMTLGNDFPWDQVRMKVLRAAEDKHDSSSDSEEEERNDEMLKEALKAGFTVDLGGVLFKFGDEEPLSEEEEYKPAESGEDKAGASDAGVGRKRGPEELEQQPEMTQSKKRKQE